jgi:hypothetical protein
MLYIKFTVSSAWGLKTSDQGFYLRGCVIQMTFKLKKKKSGGLKLTSDETFNLPQFAKLTSHSNSVRGRGLKISSLDMHECRFFV